MFCKKTYRKTRWVERMLKLGRETTDLDEDEGPDENNYEDENYNYEDDGYEDNGWLDAEDDDKDEPWLAINPKFDVCVKRGRWLHIKYIRLAHEGDTQYIECMSGVHTAIMKLYKAVNHLGDSNITVTEAK